MLLTLLVFLLVLSVLVLVHELGHFLAAKKAGIKVEEFGFGLPPRIFGIKKGETVYSINWLPIGGFVKLYGEDQDDGTDQPQKALPSVAKRAFYAQPKLTRAIVLCAGVFMNFLLAVVIITYLFSRPEGVMVPTGKVKIEEVVKGSLAQNSGLKVGDVINKINDKNSKTSNDLLSITKENLGKKIILSISRCQNNSCETKPVSLTLPKSVPKGKGAMGIVISDAEVHHYSLWKAPFVGLAESFQISWLMITELGKILWQLINFQGVGGEVSGPIGIAGAVGDAIKLGPDAVLQLMGLLSLNLAVVNILPFPALDGGRLLFVIIEGLIGKKVKPALERMAHQIGMIILLGLIALVTINDLLRIFKH